MPTLDQRLESALRRRTELLAQMERLKGKKEAAQANLKAAEEACRSRKIDPNDIDNTILKLEKKYTALVEELETGIETLATQIAPFLGEDEDEDRSS